MFGLYVTSPFLVFPRFEFVGEALGWWMEETARFASEHGVSPWIFALLYFPTTPLFWFLVARAIQAAFRKERGILFWGVSAGAVWALPYLYVLFVGYGLSWPVYAGLGLVVLGSFVLTFLRFRQMVGGAS